MSKSEEIEEIVAAWYRLKIAAANKKAAAIHSLNRLLDTARAGTTLSRFDVLEALRFRCEEYRKQKLREENNFRQRT